MALPDLDAAEGVGGKRPDLPRRTGPIAEANADYAGARSLYAQALQRNSAMGDAHLGLAKMAIREGDQKVARDHLEKYLELEPRGEARSWAEQKLASF
ncbi:MAG: tetratricopeptide repeat protein [bacterium]